MLKAPYKKTDPRTLQMDDRLVPSELKKKMILRKDIIYVSNFTGKLFCGGQKELFKAGYFYLLG